MKEVVWHGTSKADIKKFPKKVLLQLGTEILALQTNRNVTKVSALITVGKGVREIGINFNHGWYRFVFTMNLDNRLHILHCFRKKTNATEKKDIDLARQRLKQAAASIRRRAS
jgi:phage-related protein